MTDAQQRAAAKKFAAEWKGKGYEKGQSQPFWMSLLPDVYGIANPEQFILFEEQVHIDRTSFIDATIPETKVLIEQKGFDKGLKKPIRQSDGTLLTPYQQAMRYIMGLPLSKHPRWVVVCNFQAFHVYDMERPGGEPEEILLENLPTEFYRLAFLTDSGSEHLKREMEVSIAAGKIVGLLYDALLKQYIDPSSQSSQKSLNMLCVRLVFLLYAEDAGLLGRHGVFHDYLANFEARHMRKAIIDLFAVLDTLPENRDPYLEESLAAFPYVNGGLFEQKDIEIPQFTDDIRTLILDKACEGFDWSEISPTIFGAVFESTLNPQTRRSGGMHYTSLENIHKVIDPLFFDGLRKEFEEIKSVAVDKTKAAKLRDFQVKLASLSFLDPACGSGNFLTETYISLRRLENEILSILQGGQIALGDANINPIKVSIGQFYGIEINDFAVTVAKTALWIAECQMLKATEDIVHMQLEYLPLKTYANIIEGNALRMDWGEVVPKSKVSYIMGNPPFAGARLMTPAQKEDLLAVFGKLKGVGNLDFVTAWYKKAVDYITAAHDITGEIRRDNSFIRVAFVSTNSISQGEQAAVLWETLLDKAKIDFAFRTFKWNSEASDKAAVHCIIVGFSHLSAKGERALYSDKGRTAAANINPYLVDGPTLLIASRKTPLCDVPQMVFGNMPNDAKGLLCRYSDEQKEEIVRLHPETQAWFKPFLGAEEFINGIGRWCLWLVDCEPQTASKSKFLESVTRQIREKRESSSREATKQLAETPHLFGEIRQPDSNYILMPRHSSENRRYIPIGFVSPNIIAGDSTLIIPNATRYHFAILTSNVHMAWTRTVCGRLKSDYRYSIDIVYNNFPWPDADEAQMNEISKLAQDILDARNEYPDSTLADMYAENKMMYYKSLLAAHRNLDRAVMALYGFPIKDFSEADCVAALMERYQRVAGGKI